MGQYALRRWRAPLRRGRLAPHLTFRRIAVVTLIAVAAAPLALDKPVSAASPPENGRLAFIDGTGNVAIRNSAGAGLVAPQTVGGGFSSPSWSPDGERIAAALDGVGLVILRTGGTTLQVMLPWADAESPAWSPDGTKIAFVRTGRDAVYTIPVDGSAGETVVTDTPSGAVAAEPAWSADGRQLAFIDTAGGGSIVIAAADGSGGPRIVSIGGVSSPTWSPDGSRIGFSRAEGIGYVTLGSLNWTILNGTAGGTNPVWSPDGTTLAYTSPGPVLTRIPVEGGSRTFLSGTTGADQPAWETIAQSTPTTTTTSSTSTTTTTSTTVQPQTPQPPQDVKFVATADARVEKDHAKSNYGKSSSLRMDGGGDKVSSYVTFDVKHVSGTVQQALLRLYVTSGTKRGPSVYQTSPSWIESGKNSITWRNRPDTFGPVLDRIDKVPEGKWVEYDVTDAVDGNGKISFALVANSDDGMQAKSRQTSKPPQLVLTVTEPLDSDM